MISVIIPTYNQARYLRRALESVRAQGRDDLEIVVVDDGSTDDTEAVLRELSKGAKFRSLRQSNLGPAAARNRGISESRGELIAFLDSDDFWLPGKLQAQLEALERTGYRFSYCGSNVVDEGGRILGCNRAADKDSLFSELIWGNRISTPTVLLQRSLLEEVGLFDESLQTGEDWDLWLRLTATGKGACVPEPLVSVQGASRWHADERQLRAYEYSANAVLTTLFATAAKHDELAFVLAQRRQLISWHFAVLAKSYLSGREFRRFLRCALRSITSSPRGLVYLIPLGYSRHVSSAIAKRLLPPGTFFQKPAEDAVLVSSPTER